MKSLICSDIHDHISNLEEALRLASASECHSVICCGDLCSPFIMDVFHDHTKLPVHIVFGNNDSDKINMQRKCDLHNRDRQNNNSIILHGEYLVKDRGATLAGVPDDVAFAVYHYPELARLMVTSGRVDYVFFGHTHKPLLEYVDNRLFANPGSLMGFIPGKGNGKVKPSCIILDWEKRQTDLIEL